MTTSLVTEALTRAERLLFDTPVLESFIARREANDPSALPHDTADALADELVSHQSGDGSWGGSLLLTAEALLLLSELGSRGAELDERIAQSVDWIRSCQRAPGAFAEDCKPDRHAVGLCNHFATGFYSAGPRSVSFAGTALATGARLPTDEDARLALSAVALRAIGCHAPLRMDDRLQIDALRRVADLLFHDRAGVSTPAGITILATLTQMPRNVAHVALVHGALSRLARLQRADGSWADVEIFHVAETLLLGVRSGYGSPVFDSALARAADKLVISQQPDGSWGQDSGPYRLLTGWRTLRYVNSRRVVP